MRNLSTLEKGVIFYTIKEKYERIMVVNPHDPDVKRELLGDLANLKSMLDLKVPQENDLLAEISKLEESVIGVILRDTEIRGEFERMLEEIKEMYKEAAEAGSIEKIERVICDIDRLKNKMEAVEQQIPYINISELRKEVRKLEIEIKTFYMDRFKLKDHSKQPY